MMAARRARGRDRWREFEACRRNRLNRGLAAVTGFTAVSARHHSAPDDSEFMSVFANLVFFCRYFCRHT
jgi:hypothetical protein